MRTDGMRGVSEQRHAPLRPGGKLRHIEEGIAALDFIDCAQYRFVGLGIVDVHPANVGRQRRRLQYAHRIGRIGRKGIEPVDRMGCCLDVAEERLLSEGHAHDAIRIRYVRIDDASRADQAGKLR